MQRVIFNKCLNKPVKFWNIPAPNLIGMGLGSVVGMIIGGIIFGVGVGVFGFILGAYLRRELHSGRMQAFIYWKLPFSLITGSKIIPPSNMRMLL